MVSIIALVLLVYSLVLYFRNTPEGHRNLWIPVVIVVFPLVGPGLYLYYEKTKRKRDK